MCVYNLCVYNLCVVHTHIVFSLFSLLLHVLPSFFCCLSIMMAESLNTCPFCGKSFKQLGTHLYRCPERHNRDYHRYLKTTKVTEVCPGCQKTFKRLDLHLKCSKSCHLFVADKSDSISHPRHSQHSGSMDKAQPSPSSSPDHNFDLRTDVFLSPKLCLKLPPKNDLLSWNEADNFMKSVVSPAILSLTSVDEMNATLNKLIYNYFECQHGTLQPISKRTRPPPSRTPFAIEAFQDQNGKKTTQEKISQGLQIQFALQRRTSRDW